MTEIRPVLIVSDVQNGIVNPGSAHVVPLIADLAERWLAAGGTVILTRYRNYPDSPFERLTGWHGLHHAPDTDLAPEIAPLASHERVIVTDKVTYSALDDTGLEVINEHGFTDLYVCGISTDGCVMATALAAFDAGLTPWVVTDACASNATSMPPAEAHRGALMFLSRLIGAGQAITSDEAVARTLNTPVTAGCEQP